VKLRIDPPKFDGRLVGAHQLLDQLFDAESRPCIRWFRTQTKAKTSPFVRIGRLVFFNVDMVRSALANKNLVRHRVRGAEATRSCSSQ
jgi:hypothetical protein